MTNPTTTTNPAAGTPRVTVTVTDLVRLANCPQCWQRPGRQCTVADPPGDHLARWQRAERCGLIGRADLAAVVAGLEVIARHVIIRDAASPEYLASLDRIPGLTVDQVLAGLDVIIRDGVR